MSGLLKRRFCIVGLGLLGGTYAMCLKRLGCRVTAVDIDEKAICWAKEHGVIDEGTAGAPEALLSGADYITRMQKLRHPYDHGTSARRGIEY